MATRGTSQTSRAPGLRAETDPLQHRKGAGDVEEVGRPRAHQVQMGDNLVDIMYMGMSIYKTRLISIYIYILISASKWGHPGTPKWWLVFWLAFRPIQKRYLQNSKNSSTWGFAVCPPTRFEVLCISAHSWTNGYVVFWRVHACGSKR